MNNSVDITTNIGCRVQCKFCPQDDSMSNYAMKNELEQIMKNRKRYKQD